MRRTWLCCALLFLTVAGPAWAEPEGGRPSSASPGIAVAPHVALANSVLFGDTSVQRTVRQAARSSTSFFRFTSRRTGTARSISLYVGSSSTAESVSAGLYAATAGAPGSLLGAGALSSLRPGTWNTIAIRSVLVKAGHSYWIGVLGKRGTLFLRDTGSSCTTKRLGSGNPGATEVSFGCPISAYVTGALSVVHGPIQSVTGSSQTGAEPTLPDTQTTGGTTEPPTTTTTTLPADPVAAPYLPVLTLPPVNTGAPTISGTAQQGQTLTTTNGSWLDSPMSYSYQWQDCTSSSCSNIAGASSASYTLQAADVGNTIDVVVTASNSAGSASSTSNQTQSVQPQPSPANTSLPTISGTAQLGQTLSASNGSWNNSPSSYAYQWQDCTSSLCSNISGGTGSTYTLQSSDVGDAIDVVVTATNAGGTGSATSSETQKVKQAPPGNTSAPTVSGTAQEGQTLTTSNGAWTNSPTSYAYQWQDCSGSACTSISGASGSSYTLQTSDVGEAIDVVVTATNTGGSGAAASGKTQAVKAKPPTNTSLPAISGTAQQGQTLTASNGSWSDSPTSYAYQWQDCSSSCSNISGATNSSYTLQAYDVGDTIDVVVTASNSGGSASATSAATQTVTAAPPEAPSNTAAPAISGTAQQGQTLSASNGSWTNSPTSYAYQWQDCSSGSCSNISGATSSTYTLQSSDVGDTIDVVVTATNAGGSGSAASAKTQTVTAAPPPAPSNTAAPAISGTAQQGQTLTASNGSWTNSPTSYAYQWQDCSGSTCSSISGTTGATYTVQSSDVGDTIDVLVTATNPGGSASAASAKTQTVTAVPPPAPSNTAAPAISGTAQQGQTLTASNGSWTNSPTSYAYQWKDCSSGSCSNVSGATGSTYTLQSSDVGDTVDVAVTASNAGGSASATSAQTQTITTASGTSFSVLHVSGAKLLNSSGQSVYLHGVNRAGTEYSCIQGGGFFDGTGSSLSSEDAQIKAIASWGINSEMITLNEDCWLGINGAPAAYSNSSTSPPTAGCSASQCPYANAIENIVSTDEANGIHPVISLFAMAPGTNKSTGHINLADNDHAPLFWEEVADFFKDDPGVIFRLEQEPTLYFSQEAEWQCWSQGDVSYGTSSDNTPPTAPTATGSPDKCESEGYSSYNGTPYEAVGMQSMVNIVRGTGSTNIIMLPGLGYANMVSCGPTQSPSTCGMLASATPPVTDPDSPAQLMTEADVYPEGNNCGEQTSGGQPSTSCYDDTYKPVASVMPFVAGELGENPANGYEPTTYVDTFMNWMDANANGYFAYAWDTWGGLLSSYTGDSTPNTIWGIDYYDHINGIKPRAPAQPTDGITFEKSLPTACVNLSNGSIDYYPAVNSGDDLFAVFAGQGYNGTAATVNSVSDNVNGAWTEVGSSGSHTSGSVNASYSVFELLNSKAASSGVTLTVNGTSGQSGASGVVFDARGVASVSASSFQSALQAQSGTWTGPTLSSVPSGDVVLGLWGDYSGTNGTLDAPSGWNADPTEQLSTGQCAGAGMDWTQPTSAGSVTPSFINNASDDANYYGAAIDLHP